MSSDKKKEGLPAFLFFTHFFRRKVVVCPSLTDYACVAVISILREFAKGYMLRSHLSMSAFSVSSDGRGIYQ